MLGSDAPTPVLVMTRCHLVALSVASLGWSSMALADVRIRVDFTMVQTETAPAPGHYRTHGEVTYLLHGKNEISRNFNNAPHAEIAGGATATTLDAAGKITSRLRFVNGRIEEIVAYPHYTIFTQISTDGRSACRATKSIRPAPGFSDFVIDTITPAVHFSEFRFEEVTCSIESQ
jgi:hypothetical protein